ncbi:CoA pyrophosphatase [Aliamphritea spongicola]|uniref:CoA pyrophosphatase n=1 Tax=Aliamphritea spongicola TaxID=707589 RepID=UPI00196B0417|nr:CoA pyrophosphatase [Aliamphritea spongicola]MBN3564007.1 CoA pyrophosphatase [Aliamphritea spongicola]
MIQELARRLHASSPRVLEYEGPEAAVLVALTKSDDPQVVLTRRTMHLSSHGGEVAFPGGKKDFEDADLLTTALREAHEEVGLPPERVEVLGVLSQAMSKHGLRVTPYVGLIDPDTDLTPNPAELDEIFTVPLRFFLEDKRHRTDAFKYRGKTHYVPAYEYQGNIIWGLTACILVELLNIGLDAGIPVRPRPEHQ